MPIGLAPVHDAEAKGTSDSARDHDDRKRHEACAARAPPAKYEEGGGHDADQDEEARAPSGKPALPGAGMGRYGR